MTVYEIITEKILSEIDNGTIPWHKPWKSADGEEPCNAITKRPYRGINRFLCSLAPHARPYFLTYKQAAQNNGQVRKGEKGLPIIYWQKTEKVDPTTGRKKESFLLRYYTVFNLDQCDGLDSLAPPSLPSSPSALSTDERAEAIVSGYQNSPTIQRSGDSARAFYSPDHDSVVVPQLSQYATAAEYYSTLYHEVTHSTGHPSRLNRPTLTGFHYFGDQNYSKEELVAEFGAAFLCGEAGIENVAALKNSASYLDGWSKKLRGDSTLLIHAAAQAQKAADHILGHTA